MKTRFRIVEDRQITIEKEGPEATPIFYIEQREYFLFFSVWYRWPSGFSSLESAQKMVDAMNNVSGFKSRVI